jgi:hypothetical protein
VIAVPRDLTDRRSFELIVVIVVRALNQMSAKSMNAIRMAPEPLIVWLPAFSNSPEYRSGGFW